MRITGTHHVALRTGNFAAMRAFYVETLGLPQVGAFPGGRTIFIDAGTTTIELSTRDGWIGTDTGSWAHLAFEVASVDETHAELAAKEIAFHVEPRDIGDAPTCRIAFFKDPDGNDLELFQPIGSRYPQG